MVREEIAPASPVSRADSRALDNCRIARRLRFAHGYVEERDYRWARPLEDVVTMSDELIVLNMAITPRPAPMRIARAGSGFHQAEEVGRILVAPPGETVRFTGPSGRLRSMMCALSRRRFEEIAGGRSWSERLERLGLEGGGAEIEWLLNRIYQELRRDDFGREAAIDGYADALCVELARRLRRAQPASGAVRKGGLAPLRLQTLRARVRAEAPAPRVDELAQLCGMTVRQLSRAFKAETGQTIGRYIDEVTAERAIRLLTTTSRPIGEIAAELGFATSASFACALRRTTGLLPSEARRRLNA